LIAGLTAVLVPGNATERAENGEGEAFPQGGLAVSLVGTLFLGSPEAENAPDLTALLGRLTAALDQVVGGWLAPGVSGLAESGSVMTGVSIEVLEVSFVPLRQGATGLGLHRLPLPEVPGLFGNLARGLTEATRAATAGVSDFLFSRLGGEGRP